MHLLTRHATLICRRPDGGLEHHALPLAPDTPPVLRLAEFDAIALPQARGVRYQRAEGFLTACAEQPVLSLAHGSALEDQLFLPVTPEALADLGEILRQPWLIAETRAVIPRRHIRLLPDFRLRIGDFVLDLTAPVAFPRPAAHPAEARLTRLLAPCSIGPQPGRSIELVAAGPRNSALLHTEIWPVRSRRVAEMLVLAAHRQLRGHEPEQAMLEEDVDFLRDHGGPAALGDLMERLAGPPISLPLSALPRSAGQPRCPIIGLGTQCVVAILLQCLCREWAIPDRPMPFDWLTCTPALVRHCIEDDFARLLDQTQYVSLPKNGFGNPGAGAEHLYYQREFGLNRVFNHTDPTQRASYRYLELCIDRFRAALADPGPKLFVQMGVHEHGAAEEFARTAALLESRTPRAMLLQIVILPPDRRRRMPLLSLAERRGPHILYHLHPTSQMQHARFERALDLDFLAWTIASHASRPFTDESIRHAEREDLRAAIALFGDHAPDDALSPGETPPDALIKRGAICLSRFLARIDLPRRVNLGADPALPAETVLLEIAGQHATLRIAPAHEGSWRTLRRALGLIYLLDLVLRDEPVAPVKVLVALGERSDLAGAIAFRAPAADGCLIPDPLFFESCGYAAHRHEMEEGGPQKTRLVTEWDSDGWMAMLSGICVLKPPPSAGLLHWCDEALRPWVHYIPVADDLDDLLAWLHTHDAEARAIAEAGQAWARAMNFERAMEAAAQRVRDYLGKEALLF